MTDAEEKEYLKGKAAAWERLSIALYTTLLSTVTKGDLGILVNDAIKLIRDELLIDHPGLFSHAIGQGIDDALPDFSQYIRKA